MELVQKTELPSDQMYLHLTNNAADASDINNIYFFIHGMFCDL